MKIFSYGTLRNENIQLKEFNNLFKTEKNIETVENYKIEKIVLDNETYKIAIPTKGYSIKGQIVDIPNKLIDLIDKWEGESYKRIQVKTQSGIECMMYIKNTIFRLDKKPNNDKLII